ncbi:MAG: hypothetical protein ACMXYK_00505 [Candidatus Woesearchaeota archaeon]
MRLGPGILAVIIILTVVAIVMFSFDFQPTVVEEQEALCQDPEIWCNLRQACTTRSMCEPQNDMERAQSIALNHVETNYGQDKVTVLETTRAACTGCFNVRVTFNNHTESVTLNDWDIVTLSPSQCLQRSGTIVSATSFCEEGKISVGMVQETEGTSVCCVNP